MSSPFPWPPMSATSCPPLVFQRVTSAPAVPRSHAGPPQKGTLPPSIGYPGPAEPGEHERHRSPGEPLISRNLRAGLVIHGRTNCAGLEMSSTSHSGPGHIYSPGAAAAPQAVKATPSKKESLRRLSGHPRRRQWPPHSGVPASLRLLLLLIQVRPSRAGWPLK